MVPASPSRPSLPPAPPLPPPAPIEVQHGEASWYSTQSNGGTRTASGETLRDDSFTAARRTLPFGTEVRVTNLRNQRSVVVRINDRGPFRPSRIVDVSLAAAQALQMVSAGVVPCTVEVLEPSG
jgi:rare lipoprotein A